MDRDTTGKRAAAKTAADLDGMEQPPTKKAAVAKKQTITTTTTTTTKQTAPSNGRPRRKAFVDATVNMKPQPKQPPSPRSTKTKPSAAAIAAKPSPPPPFTNYADAILIAISSLNGNYNIKNDEKKRGKEPDEMKLLLPFSLTIKLHILKNMPDDMDYEDNKFQAALSYLTSKGIIVLNNDCVYSAVDSKSKMSNETRADMNDRFGLCALTFGRDDRLPTGIDYSKLPIEILTRVHHDATVPEAPIVGVDGLAETPNGNRLLSWLMAQVVDKVVAVENLDVKKLKNDIGATSAGDSKNVFKFLKMKEYTITGVSTSTKSGYKTDPMIVFQDCKWYIPLVRKMEALINGMEGKDKSDCLAFWTDAEIQLSNFQLNPNTLDVSQLLTFGACTERVSDHSENELTAYFGVYNMHQLGMFRGLPSTINNALMLELMTGRKNKGLMKFMRKERKKENEDLQECVPPRPQLPAISVSKTKYVELHVDQDRLLTLGKNLDCVAKEVAVKTFKTSRKGHEKSAETKVVSKEAREQSKKDRDDKLEKVLPEVLQVLGITSVLRGTATAADCAHTVVTLVELFSLNDIHQGLEGYKVHLGDFITRIFGKDSLDTNNKSHFFRAVEKIATKQLCKEWTVDRRKKYLHQPSIMTSEITGEMKTRFSEEYAIVQSKEAEGDSDDDKKPAANPGGRGSSSGKKEEEAKMPDLPGLP